MYLGSILDFYLIIPFYDKILHLLSGLIIGLIGYILFLHMVNGTDKNNYRKW